MEVNLEIFWLFFKISLMSIGGVFGMMPELERLIVFEHHWMTSERFLQAYVIGQFVPGPTMAFCPIIGYMVNGWGGFLAGFVGIYIGPTALVVGTYNLYFRVKDIRWVRRIELSLRPLIIGLLVASTIRLWSVQTDSPEAEWQIKLMTLVLMAFSIWIYRKVKVDLLILVLGFGLLWTAATLALLL